MKVKIYRGTNEIGGTCIEVKSEKGTTLWIDLGQPLNTSNRNIDYANEHVDALLISHPHQDHYGLMNCVGNDVPIYIGSIGLDFINAVPKFVDEVEKFKGNFKKIEAWKTFTILNDFKVTPYLTDHSTPESFSFLIEVDGKRLFYSGDFRATGRKHSLFDNIISKPPKNIDVLFMEGTMINRSNYKYNNEESIELALTDILKHQENVSFLISSAQNIDRLISCYRACKRTNKTLVIDIYTSWLLEILSKISDAVPTVDRNEIKVFCSQSQFDRLSEKEDASFIERIKNNSVGAEIFTEPEKFIFFSRCPNNKLVNRLRSKGVINIIYSQWKGYLEADHQQWFTESLCNYIEESKQQANNINFDFIHTSGHAKIEDLITYAKAINADKLIPIHTAYPKQFKNELEIEGVKNIELWKDNVVYTIR